MIREKTKEFIFTLLKSLNPKYYRELGDKKLSSSILYFLALIFIAFIVMSVLAIPKLYFIKSDISTSLLDIEELGITTSLKTAKPVLIPKDRPVLTLDTTGNRTIETERLLITNDIIYYNLLGKKGEISAKSYNAVEDRKNTENILIGLSIFLLPSIFFVYYLSYLIKYLIIMIPIALLSFIFARVFKNQITLRQALILSFYTSTPMVLLEILSLPFFISDYLATYAFLGINFSIIAITLYLTFYITAIRINGNNSLK